MSLHKIPIRIKRKMLIKKADELASLWARLNAKKNGWHMCPFCSKRPIEHCFHFITRSKFIVRWDTRNLGASCRSCNFRYEHDTVFMDDVRRWYLRTYGQEQWDSLFSDSHKIAKFSNDDLAAIVGKFEGLLGG